MVLETTPPHQQIFLINSAPAEHYHFQRAMSGRQTGIKAFHFASIQGRVHLLLHGRSSIIYLFQSGRLIIDVP